MAKLHEILDYTNTLLNIELFKDYCPNGLQVEGKDEVSSIVSAVTASQAAIDTAISEGADALLVHHGYFWRGEDQTITGIKRSRITALLEANVSLLAYHLPLDAHPEYGNNAQIAKLLDITVEATLPGKADLVMKGRLAKPMLATDLCKNIERKFSRLPLHIAGHDREIETLAWCSGGAQSYFENAIAAQVDAYLTGEASEQNYHLAKEYAVDFIAAGHHATERYGVQALGEHLAKKFSLSHKFIEIDNPI